MIRVTENLTVIQDSLARAATAAGRDPKDICLLAVSKRQPVDDIRKLAIAGQRHFGENQVQEAVDKITNLTEFPLIWHFIGSIQSNKTKTIAENFAWVHAVDRIKIANRLSEQRPAGMHPLNICLQVNIDGEASKSGVSPKDLQALATACATLPGLKLRGLMCLPAIREDAAEQRKPFAELRRLFEDLRQSGLTLDTLSMGMSDDYAAAIHEGSTIVRIGTALFGSRTG